MSGRRSFDDGDDLGDDVPGRNSLYTYDDVMDIVSRVIVTIEEEEDQAAEQERRRARRESNARAWREYRAPPRDNNATHSYSIFRRVQEEVDAQARNQQGANEQSESADKSASAYDLGRHGEASPRRAKDTGASVKARENGKPDAETPARESSAAWSAWHDEDPGDMQPFAEVCEGINLARQQRIERLRAHSRLLDQEESEREERLKRAETERVEPSPQFDAFRNQQLAEVRARREKEFTLHAAREKNKLKKLNEEIEELELQIEIENEISALIRSFWSHDNHQRQVKTKEERISARQTKVHNNTMDEALRRFQLQKQIYHAGGAPDFEEWEKKYETELAEEKKRWDRQRRERLRERALKAAAEAQQRGKNSGQGPPGVVIRRPSATPQPQQQQHRQQTTTTHEREREIARLKTERERQAREAERENQAREAERENQAREAERENQARTAKRENQARESNKMRQQEAGANDWRQDLPDISERRQTQKFLKEAKINSLEAVNSYFQEKKKERCWSSIEYNMKREAMAEAYLRKRKEEEEARKRREDREK